MVQLCLGTMYAWSGFTTKLNHEPYGFSKTRTQVIFSVSLACWAVGTLLGGNWQKKAGPRRVTLAGGVVLGAGYLLAGYAGTSFWGILLGIGVAGGIGIGLAYVCPIAALMKWFPDKKGAITGRAVAGFGFGALIWIKLTSGFVFGRFNLSPQWQGLYGAGWGPNEVWRLYGVIFMVLVGLGSLAMVNPPAGWRPAGWHRQGKEVLLGSREFSAREMVGTGPYWILFASFMVAAPAGMMYIGNISLFGVERLMGAGIARPKAEIIAGTAMGLFYALCNGMGRIIWGGVSERTGRRNAIVLMCAIQGVMLLAIYRVAGNEVGLYLGSAVIGFNYGGNFVLFAAATSDYFGNRNVGGNYPLVFIAAGVGGIIGPVLGGMMGDAGLWQWAFLPAGVGCLLVAGLALRLKAPETAGKPGISAVSVKTAE